MITKEDIESLGWSTLQPGEGSGELYRTKDNCAKLFMYRDIGHIEIFDCKRHSAIFSVGNIGLAFYGKLISDSPKNELLTIMKQIGINTDNE